MLASTDRIPLGRSDLTISRIVLGGMAFTRARGVDHAARIVDRALDLGITTVDTAPLYGFGESETIVGELLRTRSGRLQTVTKAGLRWDSAHGEVMFVQDHAELGRVTVRKNSRPDSVRLEVERSLRRLRVERLDLLQIHQFDRHVPLADTMGELARLRTEGKLGEIGVSNFTNEQVRTAIAGLGGTPLASVQGKYNLLEQTVTAEILLELQRKGVSYLAYSPLGQGLLAGRMLDGRALPDDYRRSGPNFTPRNLSRIHDVLRDTMRPIAEFHGVQLGTVALAWLLGCPGVSAVIAGASSMEQISALSAARAAALTGEQRSAIGTAFARLRLDGSARPGLLGRIAGKAKRVAKRLQSPCRH